MVGFYNTLEWRRGEKVQEKLDDILRRLGCRLRKYHKSTKFGAPKIGGVVVPDLRVDLPDGTRFWVDSKAKTKPTWRRVGQRWEHGCDFSIAKEYKKIQELKGWPVLLFVHEDESPENLLKDGEFLQSDIWLCISISDAFAKGSHRIDWPGGAWDSTRRGRNGEGGLLWPREIMSVTELPERLGGILTQIKQHKKQHKEPEGLFRPDGSLWED